MKRTYLCLIFLVLLLLSGCQQMKRISESEQSTVETASNDTEQASIGEDTNISETVIEADPISASDDSESESMAAHVAVVDEVESLTVDNVVGTCQYSVESWALYDDWTDAGISSDQLSNSYPVGESGILLVTITQYCQQRNDAIPLDHMNVGSFQPLAQSQIDSSYVDDFMLNIEYEFPASYLDKTGLTGDTSDSAYFYYPVLGTGEDTTYTLGFVLSETTRAAAEDGTLFLSYMNGMPTSKDDLLLLPVK